MNYAEKNGYAYVIGWAPALQYTITFEHLSEVAEIIEFLDQRGMPIDPSKLSPSGNTIR